MNGRVPRSILMTADAVGGVWTYALELARVLGTAGVEIALATMGPRPSPAQRAAAAAIPGLRLIESDYRLEWQDDPWRDVTRAGHWLLELEAARAPDIVHLNGFAHGSLPFSAPKVVVAHSCVVSWWHAVRGEAPPTSWERYRLEVSAGLAGADHVVAPTSWMLEEVGRHYGEPARGEVIHNGRSPALFSPVDKEPIVLAAGRFWDRAKNLAALDAAAASSPWPIYIAGDTGGDLAPAHAHALGALAPDVLASLLGRASIYALPARYEPFGLSALEAALSGCALVLGDIPSLREVWGDAALYVPADDNELLAAALTELAEDEPLRNELSRRARERASFYRPERMAASYLALYSDLLQPIAEARPCAS